MAININPGTPLRHVSTYNASGNFVAPQGANVAFVSIHSSTGGGSGGSGEANGGPGGPGLVAGAFVQIIPGGTHVVTIGAGGAGGPAGTRYSNIGPTGGTTNFDGAFSVVGSQGGLSATRYGTGTIGGTGSASGTTSLTSLSPSGALIKTGTIGTQSTGGFSGGNGGPRGNGRYSPAPNGGSAGVSGQMHIYV